MKSLSMGLTAFSRLLLAIGVAVAGGVAHAQFGPRFDLDGQYRYYAPREARPYFGQPFPYGYPGRGLRDGPPYYFEPRQFGPPDPYHAWPRYEYLQLCSQNPWRCRRPP